MSKTSRLTRWPPVLATLLGLLGPAPAEAHRIPAFARKYKVSCALCHAPVPRLTALGEDFAANGFMLARGEVPVDTLSAADPLLRLQRSLPLALRLDAYLTGLSKKGTDVAASDLQTPWGVKLLTGGQIADDVAYYMYFYLSERGEVAGLEDAYLQFNDVAGTGVDVIAGQFQLSDPMFKRELRLEYEDYQPYRVRVGEVRADLAYERGFMASYSPWDGGDLVFQLVNGQGLGESNASRTYDEDSFKNVALRYSHDLGFLRAGAFVYTGAERSSGLKSSLWVWGPDATVPVGNRWEVNLQYLRRTDGNPFFLDACPPGDFRCDPTAGDPFETAVNAYLGEVVFSPDGELGRWHFTGLYNRVDSGRPVFGLRVGEQTRAGGYADRYETVSVGAHYVRARNVRFMGELGWDFERDRARLTTGVITAF